jgi:hypothetical protein
MLAMASPPASITAYTPATITLRMARAGTALVRVRWSPQLRASGGAAVRRSGAWIMVTARRPGTRQAHPRPLECAEWLSPAIGKFSGIIPNEPSYHPIGPARPAGRAGRSRRGARHRR